MHGNQCTHLLVSIFMHDDKCMHLSLFIYMHDDSINGRIGTYMYINGDKSMNITVYMDTIIIIINLFIIYIHVRNSYSLLTYTIIYVNIYTTGYC